MTCPSPRKRDRRGFHHIGLLKSTKRVPSYDPAVQHLRVRPNKREQSTEMLEIRYHSLSEFKAPHRPQHATKESAKESEWKTTNKSTPSPQISYGFETISTISKRYDGRPAAEVGWCSCSLTVGTRKKRLNDVYRNDETK